LEINPAKPKIRLISGFAEFTRKFKNTANLRLTQNIFGCNPAKVTDDLMQHWCNLQSHYDVNNKWHSLQNKF